MVNFSLPKYQKLACLFRGLLIRDFLSLYFWLQCEEPVGKNKLQIDQEVKLKFKCKFIDLQMRIRRI